MTANIFEDFVEPLEYCHAVRRVNRLKVECIKEVETFSERIVFQSGSSL